MSTFHAFGRRLVEEHCPVQATFVEWKRLNIVKSVLKEAGVYSCGVAKSLMTLVRLSMVHIANSSEAVMTLAAEQEFSRTAWTWSVRCARCRTGHSQISGSGVTSMTTTCCTSR